MKHEQMLEISDVYVIWLGLITGAAMSIVVWGIVECISIVA